MNLEQLKAVINNGYFKKYQIEIGNIICISDNEKDLGVINECNKKDIIKEDYNYLKFFTGNFDEFFNKCIKVKSALGWSDSFIQYIVYLWLLLFNKYIYSKIYNSILYRTFHKLGFKEDMLFLDNEYSLIFNKWRNQFEITNKSKYIDWLKIVIDKRVDAIVSNSHRSSYFKAAILVVALGEVLE